MISYLNNSSHVTITIWVVGVLWASHFQVHIDIYSSQREVDLQNIIYMFKTIWPIDLYKMHGKCTYIIFVSTWSTPSPKMKMKPWSLCVWNQSLSIVRTNFQADKRFYTNPPDKGKPGWPLRALLTSLHAGATLSALKWVDWSSQAAMEEKQKNTLGDVPKTSHGVTDVGTSMKKSKLQIYSEPWNFCPQCTLPP